MAAGLEFLIGDSDAFEGDAIGNGDDVLDLGADSGTMAIGDHNISVAPPLGGSALGAGDDRINGGSADDILLGDKSAAGPHGDAGDDVINGRGGHDSLFGDNADFPVTGTFGPEGGEDHLSRRHQGDDALRAGPRHDALDSVTDPTRLRRRSRSGHPQQMRAFPPPTAGASGRRALADRTAGRNRRQDRASAAAELDTGAGQGSDVSAVPAPAQDPERVAVARAAAAASSPAGPIAKSSTAWHRWLH